MKNIAFLFLFLVSITACKTTQKAAETVKTYAPTEKTLLWKVSGKELTKPSYVFGTIHMIGKEDYFLTEPTQTAFDQMEKVVFEINMEEMNDPTVLLSLLTQAMMGGGTTLKDLLSDADYTLVSNHFTKIGLPMMMLERVKPMFLSMMTAGDLSGEGLQSGEIKSYEMELMEMAQKQKKEMDGLETLAFQLSVFDSIPYKEQATMLVDAIKGGDEGAATFEKMVQLYKDQDIIAMQQMFEEEAESASNFHAILLTNRNQNWIPIMETMMLEKSVFFAVGAGHLGGEDGVVALMRKAGYKVEAIQSKMNP